MTPSCGAPVHSEVRALTRLGATPHVLQTLLQKQVDEPLSRATVHVQDPRCWGVIFLIPFSARPAAALPP